MCRCLPSEPTTWLYKQVSPAAPNGKGTTEMVVGSSSIAWPKFLEMPPTHLPTDRSSKDSVWMVKGDKIFAILSKTIGDLKAK